LTALNARVYTGKAEDWLPLLPDAYFDSIVTDPPYEWGFMGRSWDASGIAYSTDLWKQAYQVLKPGGHLVAFGGARTYHRMTVALEDAGFEIRDSLHWLYGSGMPKGLDVSKAIDKAAGAQRTVLGRGAQRAIGGRDGASANHGNGGIQYSEVLHTAPATEDALRWDGWNVALKPAHEPVVLARKPLAGTVTQNVLWHGTGALNVGACLVAHASEADLAVSKAKTPGRADTVASGVYGTARPQRSVNDGGRWPPNVLLTHSIDCDGTCAPDCPVAGLDRQSGVLTSGANPSRRNAAKFQDTYGELAGQQEQPRRGVDSGGASRFYPRLNWSATYDLPFLYAAKAPKRERPQVEGVKPHPCVKPLAVMRWLTRLVTPPGGKVLDLFAGTGPTVQACLLEGLRCVAIEQDPDSVLLLRKRLAACEGVGYRTLDEWQEMACA
jgi:DNA modification methylase